jgi:hypothetical protein
VAALHARLHGAHDELRKLRVMCAQLAQMRIVGGVGADQAA